MRSWRLTVAASVALYAGGCLPVPPVTVLQPAPRVEFRPTAGMRVPVGRQHRMFETAATIGVEAAVELRPTFHVLGTLAWSPSRVRMAGVEHGVDVVHYDLGTEYNLVVPVGEELQLKPFFGLGAGARTYFYDSESYEPHTPIAGYGVLGTELQRDLAALRLESRLYLHGYEAPGFGAFDTHEEIAILLGFAYHFEVEREGSR